MGNYKKPELKEEEIEIYDVINVSLGGSGDGADPLNDNGPGDEI